MDRMIEVGVVGAGPYGLSVASYLREAGVAYRVFGTPMKFWKDNVPHGTCLKSDGESSDLVDPVSALTISKYHDERREAFSPATPIPVETFVSYGEAFQARFAPDIDRSEVTSIVRRGDMFALTTESGETVLARHVVLAVGINNFRSTPDAFAHLPGSAYSHSAEYGSVSSLVGKRIAVIGSGASAIDVAAVAHEAGADVTIISGRESIAFHPPPNKRKLRQKIRRPDTGIGAGWSHFFFTHGQDLFRLLPAEKRINIVTTALGPAPGWFMKDRIMGQVPIINGMLPTGATMEGDKIRLHLTARPGSAAASGAPDSFLADHVVAATGFRVDMHGLKFLDASVLSGMRTEQGAPVLSSRFETTVPNLYVVGPAAAYSFGPVMRFVFGAGFAAPRVGKHLARLAAAAPRTARAGQVGELAPVR